MNRHWRVEEIPAFGISLARRSEQWKWFTKQPAVARLPLLEKFNAVDGQQIDALMDPRLAIRTRRSIIRGRRYLHEEIQTLGGVGCALSHIGVWTLFANLPSSFLVHDLALVFEDDAVLPDDFVDQVAALVAASPLLQNLALSKGCWLLGASWYENMQMPPPQEISKTPTSHVQSHVVDVGTVQHRFFGTHAYIISRDFAAELLTQALPISCHIDAYIATMAELYDRPLYYSPRHLNISQRLNRLSDIQSALSNHPLCDYVERRFPAPLTYLATLQEAMQWVVFVLFLLFTVLLSFGLGFWWSTHNKP
jgi:GR25 family glycosyltransferase involved in LPS biosynthesis